MEKFIGVKVIKAGPEMSKKEYCEYRGWKVPEGEDANERVYLVEYEPDQDSKPNHPNHIGYISMSPKSVFEKSYRPITGLTFGLAIEALKQGKLVKRKGWNGKGMCLFMRPADSISIYDIVNNIKSLPNDFKKYADEVLDDNINQGEKGLGKLNFTAYICMKAADNTIVNGWLASQTDMLSEDWEIVEV